MASISKRESGAWQNTSYGIRATATDTITSLPTIIYADGTKATVSIKGNTVQSGTPTPENPIMPQGTGDKTANLLPMLKGNKKNNDVDISIDSQGVIALSGQATGSGGRLGKQSKIFTLNPGTYTFAKTDIVGSSTIVIYLTNATTNGIISALGTFTLSQKAEFYIGFNFVKGTSYNHTFELMLNEGSTAKPFEPYGYKSPISSANTTTPVYLGDVQTTRWVKKLVLDGTETITEESANVYSIPINDTVTAEAGLSTHFEYDSTVLAGQFRIEAGKAVFGYNDTLANFSTFLAAQYAAGTPVTVWYVLANEETAVVNEPLMKIDGYADEVNNISIPTTDGANTLSVDTTVQPSEVSVNYHGWHMGAVHERNSGQWD